MRQQRINTRGSHAFTRQVAGLIVAELGLSLNNSSVTGETPVCIGDVLRKVALSGFLPDGRQLQTYGLVRRPTGRTGKKSWQEAVFWVGLGELSWGAHALRQPDGTVRVLTLVTLDD